MEEDWVMVHQTGQEFHAEMLKKMLADHDITAVVMNKKDSSYKTFGDIEIYVKEENLLRAKTLIKEFET
jgi:hypothetical protein